VPQIRILLSLHKRPERFDHVIVETTGLADPGPVAQTFFVDDDVRARTELDSVTTVVDALHLPLRLGDSKEAVEQIAFADQLVLNKTDLVDATRLQQVRQRLAALNPTAQVHEAQRGDVPLARILGQGGFDLARLEASRLGTAMPRRPSPAPTEMHHVHGPDCAHGDDGHALGHAPTDAPPAPLHDHGIHSIVLSTHRPLDALRVQAWLTELVRAHGADILRAKGILDIAGDPRRLVFQSVHMVMEGDWQRNWTVHDDRYSRIVLIGRHLQADAWQAELEACAA